MLRFLAMEEREAERSNDFSQDTVEIRNLEHSAHSLTATMGDLTYFLYETHLLFAFRIGLIAMKPLLIAVTRH